MQSFSEEKSSSKATIQNRIYRFREQLVDKDYPVTLSFHKYKIKYLTQEDWEGVRELLKCERLCQESELDLSHVTIGEQGVEILVSTFGSLPENFVLNLKNCKINDRQATILASGLKNAPKGLTLILDGNKGITKVGMQALVDALPSCPTNFKLHLLDLKFYRSDYRPPFAWKSTPSNYSYDSVYRVLIDPITSQKSKSWPQGLYLHIDQFLPLMAALAEGLKQGSFPENFKLEFSQFNPSDTSISADNEIIKSLASPKCSAGVSINHHFPPYVEHFFFSPPKTFPVIELLKSGQYPENMHLDFTHHIEFDHRQFPSVSEEKMLPLLAKALTINHGPHWSLTMDFMMIYRDQKTHIVSGWDAVLDALKYNKNLKELRINHINAEMAKALLNTLKVNDTLINIAFSYNKKSIPAELVAQIDYLAKLNKEGKRDIPSEAKKALQDKDFLTFYAMIKRNEAILHASIEQDQKPILLGDFAKCFLKEMERDLDKRLFDDLCSKLEPLPTEALRIYKKY